ncbi:MAG: nitroreductase family protein [Atopobiaceae bacterium]|jgi:nitroreductase
MSDLLKLMEERFSVRDFSDKPIEPAAMAKILRAAQVAPTAANKQPVHVYVLQSKEALEKIRSLTRCAFNAPCVLMITYNVDQDWKNPLEDGIHAGQQDASIVATHIMLEAWSQNVGSCWVNFFANSQVRQAFGLDSSERVVLLMPLGYPSDEAAPSASHETNKPIEELVSYL